MTIRATLFAVFAVLLSVLVALTWTSTLAADGLAALGEAEESRMRSLLLADELRQSSDDLTRMARTYVVGGEERFGRYFREILAIRDGKAPRPERYQGIYWDFVAATDLRPGADGAPVALESLMRAQGFTDEEFRRLKEAKALSDALVALEDRAMNAVKGVFLDEATGRWSAPREPDPALARSLMHGAEYHRAKAAIMAPIQEFLDLVDGRTHARVADLRAESQGRERLGLWLAGLAAAFALLSLWSLHGRVVQPVRDLGHRMRDIAQGARDLTQRIRAARSDELGALAGSYNAFADTMCVSLQEVVRTALTVSEGAARIAAASRQQEATASAAGAATSQIAAAVSEITRTSEELSGTMNGVAANARDAAAAAGGGRRRLETMGASMRTLKESSGGVAQHLVAIDERAKGIGSVVTTIAKVADQSNLLSVNATIEAEKAGEHGRGFRVVAREVRHLAAKTADATLEIESFVKQMQTTVATGVAEMSRFTEHVRTAATEASLVAHDLGGVVERIQALTDGFSRVDDGMAQQATGTRQIRESAAALQQGARESLAAATEVAESAQVLEGAVASLRATVAEFRLE